MGRILIVAGATWLIATSVGAQHAFAQDSVSFKRIADTGTAEEGSRDGKSAAEGRSVAGRGMLGFIGGVPIGFLGTSGFQGDPGGVIAVGSGAAIIGGASRLGTAKPPPSQYIDARGEAYARAYSESYEKRLLERRRRAALLGGLAGTLTGFGLLILLLSTLTT